MKLPQALLTCICLLGATHLATGQVKEPAAHPIPGFLDPATGKFTAHIAPTASAAQNPEATTAATNIIFRETFQISITNYDQPGTTAVCSVDMTGGDSYGQYDESASVTASASSGGFSCTVPVLAQWALATPTSDSVYASITVTIYTPSTATGIYGTPTVYRSSYRSLTVAQPGNTQTVVNNVSIVL